MSDGPRPGEEPRHSYVTITPAVVGPLTPEEERIAETYRLCFENTARLRELSLARDAHAAARAAFLKAGRASSDAADAVMKAFEAQEATGAALGEQLRLATELGLDVRAMFDELPLRLEL